MAGATNMFFMGKGGVGKSTAAALNSLFLAQKGFQILIVSLDPAHNQSDIFETSLSDKPTKIADNLMGIEIDQDYWIRRYLKDVQNQIKRTYSYLTSFNLEKYFEVIKYSPGLEEYALILVFKDIMQKFGHLDFLMFDMPPTALGLRFFTLPTLSLIWIEQLVALRQEIIKKRDLITKVKLIKKEVETDKILNKINEMKKDYQNLKDIFEDSNQTLINIVLNPDKLSLAESTRIVEALHDINITCSQIINNKMQLHSSCDDINTTFSDIPLCQCPYSETPLIGLPNLEQFLKANDSVLEEQVNHLLASAAEK
ncbi:MAG: ArsA family ATPase [Deltaproteobacteria bacterium]|nr:ArsA family ATPase [Deltaproteobacteria bacterium]